MKDLNEALNEIINEYDRIVKGIEETAIHHDDTRAYGGIVRSEKGTLVENIATRLVEIVWTIILKQLPSRLEINKKKIKVSIKDEYISKISNPIVKDYLVKNKSKMFYNFGTDVQVFIDKKLVLPIECKSYSENAMLKRIIFDANLMKEAVKTDVYVLIQLESQLGGDYSVLQDVIYGSPSTHALLGYCDADLRIITLLEGERKVHRPIHKKQFFKPLTIQALTRALLVIEDILSEYK